MFDFFRRGVGWVRPPPWDHGDRESGCVGMWENEYAKQVLKGSRLHRGQSQFLSMRRGIFGVLVRGAAWSVVKKSSSMSNHS
jgi:hypothetical protein